MFGSENENEPCKVSDYQVLLNDFYHSRCNHFTTRRHIIIALEHRTKRHEAFALWREVIAA